MPQLITELKSDHEKIVKTLSQVKELRVYSEEGQKMLGDVKAMLLSHLEKEDDQLYPKLQQAAESDSDLQRTLNTFASDMTEITSSALEFFEKYDSPDEKSTSAFIIDYGKLVGALSVRIKREENVLYEKYLSVVS